MPFGDAFNAGFNNAYAVAQRRKALGEHQAGRASAMADRPLMGFTREDKLDHRLEDQYRAENEQAEKRFGPLRFGHMRPEEKATIGGTVKGTEDDLRMRAMGQFASSEPSPAIANAARVAESRRTPKPTVDLIAEMEKNEPDLARAVRDALQGMSGGQGSSGSAGGRPAPAGWGKDLDRDIESLMGDSEGKVMQERYEGMGLGAPTIPQERAGVTISDAGWMDDPVEEREDATAGGWVAEAGEEGAVIEAPAMARANPATAPAPAEPSTEQPEPAQENGFIPFSEMGSMSPDFLGARPRSPSEGYGPEGAEEAEREEMTREMASISRMGPEGQRRLIETVRGQLAPTQAREFETVINMGRDDFERAFIALEYGRASMGVDSERYEESGLNAKSKQVYDDARSRAKFRPTGGRASSQAEDATTNELGRLIIRSSMGSLSGGEQTRMNKLMASGGWDPVRLATVIGKTQAQANTPERKQEDRISLMGLANSIRAIKPPPGYIGEEAERYIQDRTNQLVREAAGQARSQAPAPGRGRPALSSVDQQKAEGLRLLSNYPPDRANAAWDRAMQAARNRLGTGQNDEQVAAEAVRLLNEAVKRSRGETSVASGQ